VFLDEAKRFFTDEPDNPINIIATEGRKFGLALVCASQSPTHFSEDFLSNVATKILLRLDEMYWDGSVKKLKIDLKTLKYIVPQKTIAIQIKTSDAASARFVGVDLEAHAGQSNRASETAPFRRAG
jgi:DNA helicase HerA-like ATPase